MRWSLLIAGMLVACRFEPHAELVDAESPIDAVAIDGEVGDGAIDAPAIDAPAIDAPAIDAPAIDAAIDAPTDAAIDAAIDAACVPSCSGDVLTECTPGPTTRTCDLGCLTTGPAHCGELVPSNLPNADDLIGVTGGLTFVSGNYFLDTSTGVITDATGQIFRAADDATTVYRQVSVDPPIAVLAVTQVTVPANVTVFAVGVPALIILSRGAVDIAGELDFSGGCTLPSGYTRRCGGPGAGWGGAANTLATGCAPGNPGVGLNRRTGGSGGGFATIGGAGGAAGGNPATLPSAIATCTPATLVPLSGGGGGGASTATGGAVGGGGGGAVQITSLTSISISSSSAAGPADVYAAGAGGKAPTAFGGGGGGGGAGGAILLEAPTVTVAQGRLTAAGGGGAGGRTTNNDGFYGRHDGLAAAGGAGDMTGGAGGRGANNTLAAGAGQGGDFDGSGAGGGGLGKIRVNTKLGMWTVPTGALAVGTLSSGGLGLR